MLGEAIASATMTHPSLSRAAVWKGQPYWPIGARPFTRRSGEEVLMFRWRTFCATCGAPTEATSLAVEFSPNAQPTRNCPEHYNRRVT